MPGGRRKYRARGALDQVVERGYRHRRGRRRGRAAACAAAIACAAAAAAGSTAGAAGGVVLTGTVGDEIGVRVTAGGEVLGSAGTVPVSVTRARHGDTVVVTVVAR